MQDVTGGSLESKTAVLDGGDRRPNLGCGFVAGALAGAICLFNAVDWPVMVIAGLVTGILAASFGERLWASLARWLGPPLLAKLSAVLGLVLAAPYCWFLGPILYNLYGPAPRPCSTSEMFGLIGGAVVVAPLAILLVTAIARFRDGIAVQRVWRAVSWLAAVSLLVAIGANWFILVRLLAL